MNQDQQKCLECGEKSEGEFCSIECSRLWRSNLRRDKKKDEMP